MTGRPSQPGDAGFTLLELLVVLALMGAAAALAVPSLREPLRGSELKRTASRLVELARTARAEALRSGVEHRLVVDAAARLVRGSSGRTVAVPSGIRLRLLGEGNAVDAGQAAIRFSPDGSASGAGLGLDDGRSAAEIGVDPLTGAAMLGWRR